MKYSSVLLLMFIGEVQAANISLKCETENPLNYYQFELDTDQMVVGDGNRITDLQTDNVYYYFTHQYYKNEGKRFVINRVNLDFRVLPLGNLKGTVGKCEKVYYSGENKI